MAVADSPTGPFTDLGKLIDSNEQGVDISIDAYLYQENGRNYLFWGSFRNISVLELTEDGTAIKNKASQKRREVAGGQYEAAVVLKRDGREDLPHPSLHGRLFRKAGTYRIVVGRSQWRLRPLMWDKSGNEHHQRSPRIGAERQRHLLLAGALLAHHHRRRGTGLDLVLRLSQRQGFPLPDARPGRLGPRLAGFAGSAADIAIGSTGPFSTVDLNETKQDRHTCRQSCRRYRIGSKPKGDNRHVIRLKAECDRKNRYTDFA